MLKYAKIINEETKECSVGTGTNIDFYEKIGFELLDVSQAVDDKWFLTGFECSLDKCIVLKKKYIQDKWQEVIDNRFSFDVDVAGTLTTFKFKCNDESLSRVTLSGLVCQVDDVIENDDITYSDENKTPVFFNDKATFVSFCKAMGKYRDKLDKNSLRLKRACEIAQTSEDLELVDVDSGWV